MDLCADASTTVKPKRLKSDEILVCGMMDVDQVEDHGEVFVDAQKAGVDNKGKAKIICNDEKWENHVKDALATSFAGSVDSMNPVKSATSGSTKNNLNSSNSDLSYHDNDEDCDDCDDDYEDNSSDYGFDDEFLYEDDYLAMQSQFDNVDIPPGVEASVSLPWLKEAASVERTRLLPGSSSIQGSANKNSIKSNKLDNEEEPASSSSLTVPKDPGSHETGAMRSFKQFDVVTDVSDHHYNNVTEEKQGKEWAKRIQDEWKILEKDLPDTIVVRVYEERMDLLRAIIVGPSGTPYHDGLFVFDCVFPPKYPNEPPMVYYYSGGLRLNPNLYECGKVCLSLLGTWHGSETESWVPKRSTMLQVLVSIQALILNAEPFYNEPGYENSYRGAEGKKRSNRYSENAFILSLKTMIYTLRRPPKHFGDFVVGHFKKHARNILVTCRAYTEGAKVASVLLKDGVPDSNKIEMGCTEEFKKSVQRMMPALVREFLRCGFTDCEEFKTGAGSS